jgi:DNA-binding NarL/FixJ family response regulator
VVRGGVVVIRKQSIRVLVADRLPAYAEGLRCAIDEQNDMTVAGIAHDGDEVLYMSWVLQPQMAVIDAGLFCDGLPWAVRDIIHNAPQIRLVVIGDYGCFYGLLWAIDVGVRGLVPRQVPIQRLMCVLRMVHGGEVIVDGLWKSESSTCPVACNECPTSLSLKGVLSEREHQVLLLVGRGLSNRAIAKRLFVSERTVQAHIGAAFEKLGVSSRTHAVFRCLQAGFYTIGDLNRIEISEGDGLCDSPRTLTHLQGCFTKNIDPPHQGH